MTDRVPLDLRGSRVQPSSPVSVRWGLARGGICHCRVPVATGHPTRGWPGLFLGGTKQILSPSLGHNALPTASGLSSLRALWPPPLLVCPLADWCPVPTAPDTPSGLSRYSPWTLKLRQSPASPLEPCGPKSPRSRDDALEPGEHVHRLTAWARTQGLSQQGAGPASPRPAVGSGHAPHTGCMWRGSPEAHRPWDCPRRHEGVSWSRGGVSCCQGDPAVTDTTPPTG